MRLKEPSPSEAKEKAMSSSDADKKKPFEEWSPMSVSSLEHFEDITTRKPEPGDFDNIFASEENRKKISVDAFVPFVTKEGDNIKIAEITEETIEDNRHESSDDPLVREPELPVISEEELNAIKEAAQKEGYENGYAEGFAKGQKDGFPEGRKDGFSEGKEAGHEEGMKIAANEAERLELIITAMNSAYSGLLKKNETFIIDLICRAVEKIVYGLMAIDHNIVKRAVMEAFSLIPEPEDVTVRINTEDYEFIEHVKDDFFRNISSLKQITVIADPGIAKGGCQIECAAGEVDMNIDKRLESIKKKLIELS